MTPDTSLPTSRVCTLCGVFKAFSEFSPSKTGKYGITSQCLECRRLVERERRYRRTGIAFGTYVHKRPVTEFRNCTDCKQVLPWEYFYENRSDGRCKKCVQASNARYRDRMLQRSDLNKSESKICSKCKVEKSSEEFHTRRGTKCGMLSLCKKCNAQKNLEYTRANRDKVNQRRALWRERNADWYPESRRQYNQKWYQENKHLHVWKFRLKNNRRRLQQGGKHIPDWAWKLVLEVCGGACVKCGSTERLTIDHIIPLSKGGEHDISNIQPLCLSCNDKKNVKVWDGRPVKIDSVDDLKNLLAGGHDDAACSSV